MAMKPIAVFIVAAALAVGTFAAAAKTVTATHGNSNDASVAAVAGSKAAAKSSHRVPDNKMAGKTPADKAPADNKKAKTRTAQTQHPMPAAD